jgi:hypothetical protein
MASKLSVVTFYDFSMFGVWCIVDMIQDMTIGYSNSTDKKSVDT